MGKKLNNQQRTAPRLKPGKPQKQIKESQAKNNVGAMNRSQQAYLLENPEFANTIEDLQLRLQETTDYYKYSITTK